MLLPALVRLNREFGAAMASAPMRTRERADGWLAAESAVLTTAGVPGTVLSDDSRPPLPSSALDPHGEYKSPDAVMLPR